MFRVQNSQENIPRNDYGQLVGWPVSEWSGAVFPDGRSLAGRFCRLDKLDVRLHGRDLYESESSAPDPSGWTYLPEGPFDTEGAYFSWLERRASGADTVTYAVVERGSNVAVGIASLMRIDPPNGVIEVGHIKFTPKLQRTPAATEAMYLLMRHVFEDLGYRRYEWKCDALNLPSRRAAERLGFTYEGTFRQAIIYRGRNRDTAWFSIIDSEWPHRRAAFEGWLTSDNFTEDGQQRRSLGDIRASLTSSGT